jgi:hypothetical protein
MIWTKILPSKPQEKASTRDILPVNGHGDIDPLKLLANRFGIFLGGTGVEYQNAIVGLNGAALEQRFQGAEADGGLRAKGDAFLG